MEAKTNSTSSDWGVPEGQPPLAGPRDRTLQVESNWGAGVLAKTTLSTDRTIGSRGRSPH